MKAPAVLLIACAQPAQKRLSGAREILCKVQGMECILAQQSVIENVGRSGSTDQAFETQLIFIC